MKKYMGVLFLLMIFGIVAGGSVSAQQGSGDPHDEDFEVAIPVSSEAVVGEYLNGDPHEDDNWTLARQEKPVGPVYISGDPHDTEEPDDAQRKPVRLPYIVGDPHEEK